MRSFLSKFLLSACLLLLSGGLGADDYYDEVFDNDGNVRPQYAEIYAIYSNMTPAEIRKFLTRSKADFQGDNSLHPLPRILTPSEYDVLRRGVAQRADAIRAFLRDHYSGTKSYLAEKVIPEDVLKRILIRSGEFLYEGHINPDVISFWYGPDILRDVEGVWRVLEDNPGYIGGPGDLEKAFEILLKRQPSYRGVLESNPETFFQDLVARYRERMRNPNDKIVVYASTANEDDNETSRIQASLKKLGVEVLGPRSKNRLVVKDGDVYIKSSLMKDVDFLEPVGFVILSGEHHDIAGNDPLSYKMAIYKTATNYINSSEFRSTKKAKEMTAALERIGSGDTSQEAFDRLESLLKKSSYGWMLNRSRQDSPKGLFEAILKGRVASNYSPGVEFIGDKELYMYVEDFIRFYLKEEPILRNIETRRLSKIVKGKPVIDRRLFDKALAHKDSFVVKKVDGRGGDAVWVGPKIKTSEFRALLNQITAEPESFILQNFTQMSVMDGYIVDIRVIADVGPETTYITKVSWSRGSPMKGGTGKVNISLNGVEVAVVVRDAPAGKQCASPHRAKASGE